MRFAELRSPRLRRLTVLTSAGLALALLPVVARSAEPDFKPEPANTSRLVDVALPDGAMRLTNPGPVGELIAPLKTLATQGGFQVGRTEALFWGGADYKASRGVEVKTELAERLRKGGYKYEISGEQKTDQGTVTLFVTGREGKQEAYLGSWTAAETFTLLTWGSITKAEGTTAKPGTEKTPAPSAGAQSPAGLLGRWGFTTISGTTYWDKSTGAYLGDGTGGSQTYTFEPGGKYKMFNYIKTRSYGWQVQALTWEEGTVSFDGDQVTFRPVTGKYKVMDSQVARNNYERPMKDEELKKNVKSFTWTVEKDPQTGKPVLLMGSNPASRSKYKRIEGE